ncbi:MAG: hypothetical protein JWQ96_3265 [Segetibacter sp.]|nr:hypothetical protein [Segetibacter sp.]
MRIVVFLTGFFSILVFSNCNNNEGSAPTAELSQEQQTKNNIDSLKQLAKQGDLIVRLNDDLISERVKYLNETEKLYSHTGIIVEKNNEKFVAHIAPEEGVTDTIQFIPIDSFINTTKHVSCALYRYQLSDSERNLIGKVIDDYKKDNVRFDRVYDLNTDKVMYCSEMIYKALKKTTNNRIVCKQTYVPARMRKVVATFFKKEKFTLKDVEERKIITIDNLYLMPQCSLITKFQLKHFQG